MNAVFKSIYEQELERKINDDQENKKQDITILNKSISNINVKLLNIESKQWNEFLQQASTNPWTSTILNNGALQTVNGSAKHPGICRIYTSITANSGVAIRLNISPILISGEEKTTIIFKTAAILTGVTRRIGYHDCIDQNDSTDGVYAEIIDGVINGKTASNSTRSVTETNYTVAADTWYRLVIQLNTDATLAIYTLYSDDSNTILWKDTLSTNIPTATGREVGHGDICTYSGTSAITIGCIDYMDIILQNARRVS